MLVRPLPARTRRPAAFTLMELLVVLGIICVLVAILLPALSRVRKQAQQTNCLSTLRQLSGAYTQYALAYDGQMPLGYSGNLVWTGYFFTTNSTTFVLSGAIYKAGMLPKADSFFCPSQVDPRFLYNTPENPFPVNGGNFNRIGYTCRPSVSWPLAATARLPTLAKLQNKAILADIIGIPQVSPEFASVHHRSINVLYGDFSARSIDRSKYEAIQKQIEGFPTTGAPMSLYLDEANPDADALWNVFDRN